MDGQCFITKGATMSETSDVFKYVIIGTRQDMRSHITTVRPAEYQYALYTVPQREKAGSNRHNPLRQSGTLPIMLFSLLLLVIAKCKPTGGSPMCVI